MDCCGGLIEGEDMELLEDPGQFEGQKRNRQCTDKGFIFGMASFFLVLFCFLGYCIYNGDLDRFLNGYDDCGNVCGKNNIKTYNEPFDCFGKNMEDKKFLLYTYDKSDDTSVIKRVTVRKTCVENCADHGAYVDFLNRCYVKTDDGKLTLDQTFQELLEDFQMCWQNIIFLSFLAFVFSVIMMILMRYATAFVVYFVLTSITLLLIGVTAYLWVLYNQAKAEMNAWENSGIFLYWAILMTIFTVIFLLVIAVMFKRIKLVIQLFKEAAKAIAAMPLILLQPVLTFCVLFFILFMGAYTTLWITNAGYLSIIIRDEYEIYDDGKKSIDYVLSPLEVFTSWYNFVAILWIIQFCIGCQHMIIAGCVAKWFFSRNKENLGSPILTSTLNLLRYHLGTVAVGSLIITIVQVIRTIIAYIRAALRKQNNIIISLIWCFCSHIIQYIEDFLKFFSRNAFIETAIYGHSFCVSGRRALTLLVGNIFKVCAINSVGDYVLFFTKLFVVLFTVTIGTEIFRGNDKIHHLWFPLVIVGCIAFFIAHCFITVFEMAIDTIFLCFCEDCEHNDGLSKPYYMSRNLAEFVEKTNKTVNSKNWDLPEQEAWDNGPKRILLQAN